MRELGGVRIISFDVEGTLVTPAFSKVVWHEEIPRLYARRWNLPFERAKEEVERAYDEIGDKRMEWYDIKYWFRRFDLSDYREALRRCAHKIERYPEVEEVLSSLGRKFTLIISSGSAREFLEFLLQGIEGHFAAVFSSVSDFKEIKNPGFYLKICRILGVEPGEIAHVGDSFDFDYLAPRSVGIKAFHLDREDARGGNPETVRDLWEFASLILRGCCQEGEKGIC